MMSKPRLAEILGVEVNEIFEINGYFSSGKFQVDEKGNFIAPPASDSLILDALVTAINDPEYYVVHTPKWTKQDVEDAKAMKKYFPSFDIVRRTMIEESFGKGLKESLCLIKGCQGIKIDNLKSFPSLPIGKSVKLDDIINSEPVE